jgi:drug/metabolite transporter (DMT)-like permease
MIAPPDLAVAYVQMLKSFTPVVTMLFAFLFKLERPSLLLISAVGLITAGVAVASWGEGSFSLTGVTAMAASLICEALRLVLMQSLVSKREMHPVQTLAYIAPAATAWMLLIAGVTEALAIHQAQALHDVMQHPGALVASAAAGFGANAMAMLVISLSGALTLKCLGLAKDLGLVVVGVLVLGEVVSSLQGVGYGISLLGFLLYNAARMLTGSQIGMHGDSRGAGDNSKARFGSGGSKSSKPSAAASNKPARISGGVKDLLRAHYPGTVSSRDSAEGRPLLRTPRTPQSAADPRGTPSPKPAAAALPPTSPAAVSMPSSWKGHQAQGHAVAGWSRGSNSSGTAPNGSGALQQQQQPSGRPPQPAVAAAALPVSTS